LKEETLRRDIVEIGRRLHERAYIASNDGNISVRLEGDLVLTTPKGVSKGFMSPDMMVVTDMSGRKMRGQRDPSSEMLMHLEVYRSRPDVNAVVHAHPPVATGFAVAGIPLDRAVLAEVITTLGSIPIADYGTPSTQELPDAVRKYIKAHDGLLLANHGALTVAGELFAAYYKMETIEHFARISLVARLLGRERLLSREEVERLQGLRGMYGIAAPAPICTDETTLAPADEATCQVIQAPSSPGARLVNDALGPPSAAEPPQRGCRVGDPGAGLGTPLGPGPHPEPISAIKDGEIRLTYRELTALIEEAVKALR